MMNTCVILENVKSLYATDEGSNVIVRLGDTQTAITAGLTIEAAKDLVVQLQSSIQHAQYGQ